jgi:RNA polymerase sigma-70 factor (ECF subfamily)
MAWPLFCSWLFLCAASHLAPNIDSGLTWAVKRIVMNGMVILPQQNVLSIRPDADRAPEQMAELVARIREGSESGMQELYYLVLASARPYLRWRLGSSGSNSEVDDRLHDTYLAAMEAIVGGTIREPERLMGFLRAVVRHQTTAAIRRAASRRRTDDTADQEEVADQRPTPERCRMEAEQHEMMETLLQRMKHRDRDILQRFYLDDQPQEQICSEMNLTQTQFRLYKSRAKARFSLLAVAQMNRRQPTRLKIG